MKHEMRRVQFVFPCAYSRDRLGHTGARHRAGGRAAGSRAGLGDAVAAQHGGGTQHLPRQLPQPRSRCPCEQEVPSPPPCTQGLSSHLCRATSSIFSSPLTLPLVLSIPQCPGVRGLNRSRDEAALTSPKLPWPPRQGRQSERNEPPASLCPWEGKHGQCLAVPISTEQGAGAGGAVRAVRAV